MNHSDLAQIRAAVLDESIMQKGKPASAGSKILEGFIAPFDATVTTRLREKNIQIADNVAMDEFGIGTVSKDIREAPSAAVNAVCSGNADFALCNDIFGKHRRESAENGVCYIHPSYGTVSRYGLIPLACSMDQIGIVCKDISDGFELLSIIAGHDPKDGAMFPQERYRHSKIDKTLRVGFPSNVFSQTTASTREHISQFAGKFEAQDINLDYFEIYKQVFYILACAEISGNINRYDGIKYGYRADGYSSINDLYLKTRTHAFGLQTKLAAVIGSMVLSRDYYLPFYEKAMKIRGLIKQSLAFDNYDIIVLPTNIGDDPYENLSLFALAPLVGLPSVTFSYRGQPVQLIANAKNESALLTAWEVAGS